MSNEVALHVLTQVRWILGRRYKSAIRHAWETGDYYSDGLSQFASQLQNIRNTLGPSWLVRAQPR